MSSTSRAIVAASVGVMEAMKDQMGILQMELYYKIGSTKYKEPSPVHVSGQEPLLLNFCSGFKQSKRQGENEEVRRVFEDSHVLELLGSQFRVWSTEESEPVFPGRTSLPEDHSYCVAMAMGNVKPKWS